MSKVPYTKSALSYAEQIHQLKQRGLIIENELKVTHLLEVISYYRLSGYWYPMLADKQNHTFKPNSTFETAFNIYKFDRELRLLVLSELEKIEVAVRAKMFYILSMIIFLMNTINPKHKIQSKFKTLLEEFPNIDTKAMGFPNNWQTITLWQLNDDY
jgi:abortive infection bacteriophage resistance protein